MKQVKPKMEKIVKDKTNITHREPVEDRAIMIALNRTFRDKTIVYPNFVTIVGFETDKKEIEEDFIKYTNIVFYINNLTTERKYVCEYKRNDVKDFIYADDTIDLIRVFLRDMGLTPERFKDEYKKNLKETLKELEDIKETFLYDN